MKRKHTWHLEEVVRDRDQNTSARCLTSDDGSPDLSPSTSDCQKKQLPRQKWRSFEFQINLSEPRRCADERDSAHRDSPVLRHKYEDEKKEVCTVRRHSFEICVTIRYIPKIPFQDFISEQVTGRSLLLEAMRPCQQRGKKSKNQPQRPHVQGEALCITQGEPFCEKKTVSDTILESKEAITRKSLQHWITRWRVNSKKKGN